MQIRDTEWDELLELARRTASHAYAPYSNFAVGAALLDREGKAWGGCNVENASFPLGICAERSAVAMAVGAGARVFRALALSVPGSAISTPCGACRQVLFEFAPALPILVEARESGKRQLFDLADLLPHGFMLETE